MKLDEPIRFITSESNTAGSAGTESALRLKPLFFLEYDDELVGCDRKHLVAL